MRDWIRECIAAATSRLDDDAWDLWLLCGKNFDMKEQEQKTAESMLKTLRSTMQKVTVFSVPPRPSRFTLPFGNSP